LASPVIKPKVLSLVDPVDPNANEYKLEDAVINFAPLSEPPDQFGAYPGKIISGSGYDYRVHIWPDNDVHNMDAGKEVNVEQLQIYWGSTIPADTYVIVVKSGGKYYMQVPIWLYDV
jgi:hypothetical protein